MSISSTRRTRASAEPDASAPAGLPTDFDDLGARLRTLRTFYGLSQRELARRTGMANGTISLIEQGQVSPSVASLKRLLQGFPLSLAEFFTFDPGRQARCFYAADELPEIAGGRLSYRLVGSDRSGRRLQVIHERYEPQGDSGQEMISHPGEEAGVVVRGRIEITVGGQTKILSAGDAYYFDSRQPHRFRNPGTEVCEIVSACTPPSF